MLYVILVLFAISAVLGLIILSRWLTHKDASKSVVYSHGIAAATGLVLLIIYAVQTPLNYPKISIILLVIAAIGGLYMFFNDLRKKNSPMAIAFIHALLAVGGFILLLIFVFV